MNSHAQSLHYQHAIPDRDTPRVPVAEHSTRTTVHNYTRYRTEIQQSTGAASSRTQLRELPYCYNYTRYGTEIHQEYQQSHTVRELPYCYNYTRYGTDTLYHSRTSYGDTTKYRSRRYINTSLSCRYSAIIPRLRFTENISSRHSYAMTIARYHYNTVHYTPQAEIHRKYQQPTQLQ